MLDFSFCRSRQKPNFLLLSIAGTRSLCSTDTTIWSDRQRNPHTEPVVQGRAKTTHNKGHVSTFLVKNNTIAPKLDVFFLDKYLALIMTSGITKS